VLRPSGEIEIVTVETTAMTVEMIDIEMIDIGTMGMK